MKIMLRVVIQKSPTEEAFADVDITHVPREAFGGEVERLIQITREILSTSTPS